MMLEDVRKYVQAGIEALMPAAGDDAASALLARMQAVADQLSDLARGFLQMSAEARADLTRQVADVVSRQAKGMGLATGTDLKALADRIVELETMVKGTGRGSGATPTSSPKRATTPKRATGAQRATRGKGSTVRKGHG